MTRPILVTGGTGTLGRAVVERLLAAGREVRVLSRRPAPATGAAPYTWMTGDLRTGGIIHCASGPRGDVQAARRLIEAAHRAGAPHLIYISIVGVDRVPLGYYRAKLDVERLIESSGLPWTILRATQFHDLILHGCGTLARLPVILVPAGTSFQPIEVGEVADRLVELSTAAPAGRVPDMGGPEVRSTRDLAYQYLRAADRHRRVLPVRIPGAIFSAFRVGGHLAPDRAVGRLTFEEFLAERVIPARGADTKTGRPS